jgi:protein-disulfide isomerase
MSKSEVEGIVRDYILENPEIIIEALQVLEKREQDKELAIKKQYLSKFLALDNLPTVGPEDAPITIVEFFDYNCSFCKRAAGWVDAQLEDERQDVRVVFIELPVLESRTKTSALAARAALAAAKQGKYKEFHLALMEANGLNKTRILKVAETVGVDVAQLEEDMESKETYALLDDIMKLAREANILATPGFFINDEFVSGANIPLLTELIADARS